MVKRRLGVLNPIISSQIWWSKFKMIKEMFDVESNDNSSLCVGNRRFYYRSANAHKPITKTLIVEGTGWLMKDPEEGV